MTYRYVPDEDEFFPDDEVVVEEDRRTDAAEYYTESPWPRWVALFAVITALTVGVALIVWAQAVVEATEAAAK